MFCNGKGCLLNVVKNVSQERLYIHINTFFKLRLIALIFCNAVDHKPWSVNMLHQNCLHVYNIDFWAPSPETIFSKSRISLEFHNLKIFTRQLDLEGKIQV